MKNLLYSLAMFVFITIEFYLLLKLGFWLFKKVDAYQPAISQSLYYFLFFIANLLAIFIINDLLVFIVTTLIRKISKISPDRKYAVWFTRIYSIVFCVIAIFQLVYATESMRTILACITMSIVLMRAVYVNIVATNESLLVNLFVAGSDLDEKQFRAEMKAVMKPKKSKEDEIITSIKKRIDELNRAGDKDEGF
ncbi:hypothetical protein VRU48_01130 [Pedobacter sp. KR3-3]|uniref:Uncharacterized protein n=1 Tax=Pedobacter albus TaxID=3113905 RepID=A0ABU7I356_9SPHI|nr:hypothetical protein [Pedobacter sp. KR3-3]MEE1943689.1 hypothetical protein [Pedobacter sp. KR3-3]